MSSTAGQSGSPSERVRHQAEIRALEEARRVRWKVLVAAAEEYTEWQVFGLWIRAVLDSSEILPGEIATQIRKRAPFVLARIESKPENVLSPGAKAWEDVTHWTEANLFTQAMRDGWLNAIRYFSSTSLLSMKAWAYWEEAHRQWRVGTPRPLPDYDQWAVSVSSVTRLANPESEAQTFLDSIRSIPSTEWQQMSDAFIDLATLCLWIETVLGAGQAGAELVLEDLTLRYPRLPAADVKNTNTIISSVMDWVTRHEAPFAEGEPPLAALGYLVKGHPAYHARRNYATRCRRLWLERPFERIPSFTEWRNAADCHFER